MKNALFVLGIALIAIAIGINSCKKDDRFKCVSGNCEFSSDGPYTSLEDCEANCEIERYTCIDGSCERSITGEYRNLEDCQSICEKADEPKRYDCIDGTCLEAENGEYDSLSLCQQNCQNDTTVPEMQVNTISANLTSNNSVELNLKWWRMDQKINLFLAFV